MSTLIEELEQRLDEVIDPCSAGIGRPAGLVTMGLVKSLEVVDEGRSGKRLKVCLRLTSPCCMMGPHFAACVEEKLKALPDVLAVEVAIAVEIDWEPSHMRPQYRAALPRPRFMPPIDG
jgi:metal-sulfur cluster biosynthetic enzyme